MKITQPILDSEELEKIITPYKTSNCHFSSLSAANRLWNIIIKIKSENNDSVFAPIFEELKGAKSQFSQNRPGLLAIRVEGVHPDEWSSLATGSSLAKMTSYFFEKENCPFIHSITYSSDISYMDYGKFIDSNTKILLFKNHLCSFYPNDDIFSLKKSK